MTARIVETAVVGTDAPRSVLFQRPAELVDVSERMYRGLFSVGLWVAVGCAAFAVVVSVLQNDDQLRGSLVCAGCVLGIGVAAVYPAQAYRVIRRHPSVLVIAGAILGVAAVLVGRNDVQLFLPMVAIIGVLGIAAPLRVVAAAAVVAAAGLAVPHVAHGEGDIGAALVVVVPPVMYWLIVESIARFALQLHRGMRDATSRQPAPRATSGVDGTAPRARPAAASRSRAPRPALPQPAVIRIGGASLTSRQLQVVLLACEGLRQAEIGACLGIGPQQVGRHMREARRRTGTATGPQLMAWARAAGLVPRGRSSTASVAS